MRKDLILRTYLNGGPDNVTAVGDELWIGGQNTDLGGLNCIPEDVIQCSMPFFIIRADRDLNILEEYNFKDVAYGGASVAYPFEDKVFIGAINRQNRFLKDEYQNNFVVFHCIDSISFN